MKLTVAVIVFFFSFYRLEVFFAGLFPAAFFGLVGAFFLVVDKKATLYGAASFGALGVFVFMSLFFLPVDIYVGVLSENFTNSFFIRSLSIVLLSFLTAYIIVKIYILGEKDRLVRVVFISFLVQLLFWVITFSDPGLKAIVYEIFMQTDSVNLRDHNISARGFGASKEINFTSPFMMTVISLMLFKGRKVFFSFANILTQVVNSNLVLVAAAVGFWMSPVRFVYKAFFVVMAFFSVVWLGEDFFGRLYAEVESGGGVRTINALLSEHFFYLNRGFVEHLLGGGYYIFQGGDVVHSDVGWVIMYNYGGVFFLVLFLAFLWLVSLAAFGFGKIALLWFVIGLILNTKGLVFGPNSYFFMSFLFYFYRGRGGDLIRPV